MAAGDEWIGDEVRMVALARQVLARALRRPLRVFVFAAVATVAVVGGRAAKAPTYEATLYFHLLEGDLIDPRNAPRPLRDIRQYISTVALSRERVERLMQKYHVSSAYLARNREAAIDDFKDEIQVDVSRNYFLYDRRLGDEPRSAQVTIALSGDDAARARAMVHEIGDAILQDQKNQRTGRLNQARELFGERLDQARDRVRTLQASIDRLWVMANASDPRSAIAIRAQIAATQAETRGAIDQMLAVERRSSDLAFSANVEGMQLGLRLELFDESLATFAARLTPLQLVRLTVVVFAIALLVAVAMFGAFDDRVYAAEDLVAQGLPVFGALSRFPGDDAGAYRARAPQNRV
jgi:hypothetical protein